MKATCEYCTTRFSYERSRQRGRFCSVACSARFVEEVETPQKIVAGKITNPVTLKRYLVRVRGNHCVLCDNAGMHNGLELVLELDHIDGDSDNNLPSNLRLLCPNCHSQQPTSKQRTRKVTQRNKYLQKYKNGQVA